MNQISSLNQEQLLTLTRAAASLRNAPEAWINDAKKLWGAREKRSDGVISSVAQDIAQRIRAVISFDSWNVSALASGLRASPSQTRHLLFAAQGRDVDLRINPSASSFIVSGQVLGSDEFGALEFANTDEQSANSRAVRVVTLNSLGAFSIDGVLPGIYSVTLRMHRTVIELPPIGVGESAATQ